MSLREATNVMCEGLQHLVNHYHNPKSNETLSILGRGVFRTLSYF